MSLPLINLAEVLQLSRPLAVFDLETTGFDYEKDRICQIAITMHYPSKPPVRWASLVNPGVPIPPGASKVHGITDDMVRDAPAFEAIAPALAPRLLSVDLMGYNVEFDIKFMRAQMRRIGQSWPWDGHSIDAFEIYRTQVKRTLKDAWREFGGDNGEPLPRDADFEGAHDAGIDVTATEVVLRGQLLRFKHLPRTVKELSDVCYPDRDKWVDSKGKFLFVEGVPTINFGKHKGTAMKDVPRDYYRFITDKDFEPELKRLAADALKGIYPTTQKELDTEGDGPLL